jgi:hypothetical protein
MKSRGPSTEAGVARAGHHAPWTRRSLLLLGGLAALYGFILTWYHSPYAGGADSAGYMVSAQMLLEGQLRAPVPRPEGMPTGLLSPSHWAPLCFRLDATGEYLVPAYPVGLPLHYALVGWFIGVGTATTLVGVASALAFAILLYVLGREFGLRVEWSLGLALVGAFSPLTIYYALQPMSDLVATVWVMAAILAALRSTRHLGWAGAGGAAFAMAVLVRPTNALILLPLLLALRPSLRAWVAFGLGGLPGAGFYAFYHQHLFGSVLGSGYGSVGGLFDVGHMLPTLWHYAIWGPVVATPLIVASWALPWTRLSWRRQGVLLAWGGGLVLLYTWYEFSRDTWWYLRFILPALPAWGIAAALVLQRIPWPTWFLLSRLASPATPAAEVVRGRLLRLPLAGLIFVAAWGWMLDWGRTLRVTKVELDERGYLMTARWIERELSPEAVLVGLQVSGSVFYYTRRPVLDQNAVSPQDLARLDEWLVARDRPLYAILHEYEIPVLLRNLPGRWEPVTRLRQTTVWRRAPFG